MNDRKLRQDGFGTGFLQIEVYGVNIADPIDDAFIEIIEVNNQSNLTVLHTDKTGRTQIVSILAPALINSMEPTSTRPFSTCDLRIEKEGYVDVYISGVQIFPESVANQAVFLTKTTPDMMPKLIDIQDPVLWGDFPAKIPEDPVKELTGFTGLVVLPEVIIPEYIVVHEGVPDDTTGTNHKVLFKDYIKNVASCEIYSNWPEQTLRANILAIISFALNRVYTEWYRSKGYNFTITNTTSHDQAFDFGRNIFNEISVVVDDLFNSFITKPDIQQPLLAQYCDGKESTCPNWLSQWGSKYLGDQGENALTILRKYYGQEVYLDQAAKVEGIPESFVNNLSVGSTGNEVRVLQEQLNQISTHYPLIEKVKETGAFDEQTKRSVEIFQEVFSLPVTGIVDRSTWYNVSRIFVAVTKMAEIT